MNAQTANGAFSIAEFCRAYSLGRSTVYAEIRCGRLIAFKCGKRTLISMESAERWRRDRECETATHRAQPAEESA